MIQAPLSSWSSLDGKITKPNKSNKAVLVYNILNKGTAPCLRESFSERTVNENGYNLRNYDTDLSIPRTKNLASLNNIFSDNNYNKKCEPSTFRLTAERFNRLRHREVGNCSVICGQNECVAGDKQLY